MSILPARPQVPDSLGPSRPRSVGRPAAREAGRRGRRQHQAPRVMTSPPRPPLNQHRNTTTAGDKSGNGSCGGEACALRPAPRDRQDRRALTDDPGQPFHPFRPLLSPVEYRRVAGRTDGATASRFLSDLPLKAMLAASSRPSRQPGPGLVPLRARAPAYSPDGPPAGRGLASLGPGSSAVPVLATAVEKSDGFFLLSRTPLLSLFS